MSMRIGAVLLLQYRDKLDKLPESFLFSEAKKLGITRPLLIKMKHSGLLTNKKINDHETVWYKKYT